jgi:flagellar assembly factor FliW
MTSDLPILNLDGGLVGFPEVRRFALVRIDPDTETLFRLRCLDAENVEFVVAAPYPFFPDYAPEIDEPTARRLEIAAACDAMLLVVLTVGRTLATTTANLFAPIVVNVRTHQAAQILLSDSGYPLKEPLAPRAAPAVHGVPVVHGAPVAQRIA